MSTEWVNFGSNLPCTPINAASVRNFRSKLLPAAPKASPNPGLSFPPFSYHLFGQSVVFFSIALHRTFRTSSLEHPIYPIFRVLACKLLICMNHIAMQTECTAAFFLAVLNSRTYRNIRTVEDSSGEMVHKEVNLAWENVDGERELPIESSIWSRIGR